MAQAHCLNEDCDKDPWTLRKPLDEYDAGPTCPDCGTTRIQIRGGQQTGAEQRPQGQGQPEANVPVEREQQVQAQPPATQSPEHLEQGMQLGDTMADMMSGDPEKEAEAKGQFLQLAGATVARAGQRMAEREKQQTQNARNTDADDVEVASKYPPCPECGGLLTKMPAEGEFNCQHCGVPLVV